MTSVMMLPAQNQIHLDEPARETKNPSLTQNSTQIMSLPYTETCNSPPISNKSKSPKIKVKLKRLAHTPKPSKPHAKRPAKKKIKPQLNTKLPPHKPTTNYQLHLPS